MAPGTYAKGRGQLRVARVDGRSTVLSSSSRNPLRVLTPRACGGSVWAYTSSFGGGMVAGDQTALRVELEADAKCFLTTQASTKIYRNPARLPCSHRLEAELAAGTLLVVAPDPVQCFAEAEYSQEQQFRMDDTASLVLVDWISCGRAARGERWAFRRYASRNEIWRGGRRVLMDAVLLEPEQPGLMGRFVAGEYNCLGTVVVIGSALGGFAREILGRVSEMEIEPGAPVILSASALQEGVILRYAGKTVEGTGQAIFRQLSFVAELLQGDPWARKW